ncbi:elongin-B isoform X1 [Erinaceus europaeus]|uniref:Elongin-B isoform X1 n=1 Tax=Erinaceus europaeus TaxID=9365 RepID=A0ABM3VW19_ERIEU|nr:elongin-B isoform X1 [Erinaceus europaeus]
MWGASCLQVLFLLLLGVAWALGSEGKAAQTPVPAPPAPGARPRPAPPAHAPCLPSPRSLRAASSVQPDRGGPRRPRRGVAVAGQRPAPRGARVRGFSRRPPVGAHGGSLLLQDVFLMIRRHKTTIFTDAKESSTVFELKRIVEGILKRPPDEQRLYKDDQLLDDGKTLGECGFTSQTARPQAPATVGLAFRADEAFEALRIEPFSSPPELPDVMKPQDSGSSANEQAVQ